MSQLSEQLLLSLGLSSFVAIDVETTGLDANGDRIIEIGAVRFRDGQEAEEFSSLIRCPFPLPENIIRLTGIRDAMLKTAPDEKSVLNEFLGFVGEDPLVGHNVQFDLSFLHGGFKRTKSRENLGKRNCADSALIARVLLPTLPSRSLSALARYFGLPGRNGHRALPDARRSGQVLINLLSYFERVDIKAVALLRRLAEGLHHPSAWIFAAWSDHLMQTSSLEGRFQPHNLPYLTDNILGKLPSGQMAEAKRDEDRDEGDYERIDEDEISSFFESNSSFARSFPGFEFRPQQEEMAKAVATNFNEGGYLAAEAGTGVGKSLAYLVPAIYWAQSNRDHAERVIVSTNTRNLQDQLFFKDLPSLVDHLPFRFSAVLLKGRSNYLCRRRWENLTTDQPLRLSSGERLSLLPLVLWADQTRTGDIAEVGAFGGEGSNAVWGRIASDPGTCRGKRCQQRSRCFHQRIRAAAARAHILVVNHALLMSDLAADRIPIGAYSTLVIDEAHHLERAASQHLGKELNAWMFRSWTSRMYDAEGVPTGLLAQILLGLGAASSDHPVLPGLKRSLEETADQIVHLRQASADFFQQVTSRVRQQVPPQDNTYSQKLRLREPGNFLGISSPTEVPLMQVVSAVDRSLGQCVSALSDVPVSALPRKEDWQDELSAAREEIQQIQETLRFFFAAVSDDWVYWAELPRRQEYDALLYAAPLNAGDILRHQLFAPLRSAVMTSATLTVAGRFHYFLRKVGLHEQDNARTLQPVRVLRLGSPFDFERQMLIGLPSYLPSPRQPQFEQEVIRLMQATLQRLPRGTLGLFTSHRMLTAVGEALGREKAERRLLVQGQNGSRDQLLRRFREEPGSILLGTDSFWEGIDVMGEALELLLVAKLPFEVPSEPLVEARLEKLKAEGKDPFMYYTVPEAIIRLRQGIGRLIRSRTDRGAALICDSRLVSSRYREAFLQSLPVPVKVFDSQEDMIRELEKFFDKANDKLPELK